MGEHSDTDGFGLAETGRSLPMTLLKSRETVMDRFRPLLRENAFTEQQWRVLRILNECSAVDSTQLALRANILVPSLTRILRSLEARSLVTTRKDDADKRRVLASLTHEGTLAIRRVSPSSHAVYREIESAFGQERIENLIDELEALIAAVNTLGEPHDPS